LGGRETIHLAGEKTDKNDTGKKNTSSGGRRKGKGDCRLRKSVEKKRKERRGARKGKSL